MPLSTGAQAFADKMNKLLKEELLVSADQLAIPARFPTGSLSLDVILGGGLPGNQWTEVVGLPSAGKTFLALKAIAENQRADPAFTTLWVAAEHYNHEWAEALGVDNHRVMVAPTMQMEKGLQVLIEGLDSAEFDCFVLDSFPAMLPDEEAAKAMDEFTTAVGARTVGKFLRKAGDAGRRPYDGSGRAWAGIFINQYRDKVGGFAPRGIIPKTTPGGNAKDYFCYARIEVKRAEWIKEKRPGVGEVIVGQVNNFKTIKNKSAAPQQSVEVPLYFRRAPVLGFSRGEYDTGLEFVKAGKLLNVFELRGSRYWFGGQEIANGFDNTVAAVLADKELQLALRAEVLEAAADPRRIDMLAGESG